MIHQWKLYIIVLIERNSSLFNLYLGNFSFYPFRSWVQTSPLVAVHAVGSLVCAWVYFSRRMELSTMGIDGHLVSAEFCSCGVDDVYRWGSQDYNSDS